MNSYFIKPKLKVAIHYYILEHDCPPPQKDHFNSLYMDINKQAHNMFQANIQVVLKGR